MAPRVVRPCLARMARTWSWGRPTTAMPRPAGHRPSGDERVDDGLFGGAHRGLEERRPCVVREHARAARGLPRPRPRRGVGGREGEEEVARAVSGHAAGARQPERRPARQALQLVGRSGASVATTMMMEPASLLRTRPSRISRPTGKPADPQLVAKAVVRLDEDAHRVAALGLGREDGARRCRCRP